MTKLYPTTETSVAGHGERSALPLTSSLNDVFHSHVHDINKSKFVSFFIDHTAIINNNNQLLR